jgi:hypothetical protein
MLTDMEKNVFEYLLGCNKMYQHNYGCDVKQPKTPLGVLLAAVSAIIHYTV